MAWFSARLLFESEVHDDQKTEPLCEESIRLVDAQDEAEARHKAEQIGREEQHEYRNEAGVTVRWKCAKVLEVQDLCESRISDGMEVYSRLFRKSSEQGDDTPGTFLGE